MLARLAVIALLAPALAMGAPGTDVDPTVDDAVKQLSHYPAGQVPVDPTAIDAIHHLGEHGDRTEVSLLRSLVDHERPEIQRAAVEAIGKVRTRQRAFQRAGFAKQLPQHEQLRDPIRSLVDSGSGQAAAECLVYARQVLGDSREARFGSHGDGDPSTLLEQGKPRKALAALAGEDDVPSLRLAARALEDMGDVRGALHIYLERTTHGDLEAVEALEEFGVDRERLLLGRMIQEGDARILELLVRTGGERTVRVLAERLESAAPSDRATAADALGRMLDPEVRHEPLTESQLAAASKVLTRASREAEEPVRQIAREALAEL